MLRAATSTTSRLGLRLQTSMRRMPASGLRQSAILALVWGDLDFAGGFVHVRRQLSRKGERVELKTENATRSVVMMASLGRVLREWKAASPHCQDNDLVFATKTGQPLGHPNVLRAFNQAVDAAKLNPEGVRRLWFHDCRRTFASILIGAGADVVAVSRQLGHSNPSVTLNVYSDLFDRARHADTMRASLDAAVGNVLETTGGDRRQESEGAEGVIELDLARSAAGGTR